VELIGETCTARLFQFAGGRPLCTQILPGQGRPSSTILGIRKLETRATRWWRPHPSAFPCFDTIPECDGRTEGRICRSVYSGGAL